MAGLVLLWLFDLVGMSPGRSEHGPWAGLPAVAFGTLTALALLAPEHRPRLEVRAGVVGVGSLLFTPTLLVLTLVPGFSWGLLETVSLLALLFRTVRRVRMPVVAVALSVPMCLALLMLPLRVGPTDVFTLPFLMTFVIGGTVGLGCYVRLQDVRRVRAMAVVREGERRELARELHDFVAHHVTGIITHANAALVIQETSPEQVKPLLEGISRAGSETLDSMRRLVRVLREDEEERQEVRPGELFSELERLVAGFSGHDTGTDTRLEIGHEAHDVRLAPEVETSVHRVVQEALTNVRRHAPDADTTVRVGLAPAPGRLRVDVHNSASAQRPAVPTGGRSGLGLVGLRERVEAVQGTLRTGRTTDAGWHVTADFPTLAAVPT